jgi:hypothetical protein
MAHQKKTHFSALRLLFTDSWQEVATCQQRMKIKKQENQKGSETDASKTPKDKSKNIIPGLLRSAYYLPTALGDER